MSSKYWFCLLRLFTNYVIVSGVGEAGSLKWPKSRWCSTWRASIDLNEIYFIVLFYYAQRLSIVYIFSLEASRSLCKSFSNEILSYYLRIFMNFPTLSLRIHLSRIRPDKNMIIVETSLVKVIISRYNFIRLSVKYSVCVDEFGISNTI